MRNPHIDILKTIAITSVIIGHIFPSTHSFLRAHDIFFVIAGYFSMMSIEKYTKEGIFHSYFKFITRRLWRFLPIIAIAGILCLAWGYWVMLPDDYENLANQLLPQTALVIIYFYQLQLMIIGTLPMTINH